ncbi:translocation/assembly module TamB domain-containing protein [Rhizobium sp. TH2]|uniref:translocation/assembly module TamB domain-containing protein n=1 Tax=Rhizobium sp. TH2 TaxID=2775403 RepID=UPI0021576015|nr:translocation/assembly module TamB domain-containing protein [Rhizobium sp. TH2]UVC11366.1 translocation/assembly module TamB domain-containing protein [Rhizobium sp. TH2]
MGVLGLVLIALILLVGYTATGNQFAADQIASRISTPDMQVTIEGARGLLAGKFRVDRVELADTKGKYAELKDIELDWSPLDLLSAQFHAQRIAVSDVNVKRQPVVTIEPEPTPSEGGFSLPVEIAVDAIDLPSIVLGKPLIGREAKLAIKGSARAAADAIALKLNANQTDRPDAKALADLAYAVNANTLKLDLKIAEPRGGLLATALQLPGGPAVDLSVAGDGALSDWSGIIRARLDGVERLAVNASHRQNAAGMHDLNLNGGGAIGDLMPPALRPLFEGESAVDLDASFDNTGQLDIRAGKLTNGSFTLDASGKIDPKGEVSLNGSVHSVDQVIPVRLPVANGELQADIRNASFVASGPYKSVAIDLSADIATLALPQGRLTDVFLRSETDGFDLATRAGRIAVELTSQGAAVNDPQFARLVVAPIDIKAPFDITATRVASDAIEISSGAIGGKITLDYALDTATIASAFNLFVAPARALPEPLASKVSGMIELSGKVDGKADDLAFDQIRLASNLLTAEVSGTLKDNELTASLTGDIPALAAFQPGVDGRVHVTADLSGPLSALVIKAGITSDQISTSGRKLQTVDVKFDGTIDPAKPGGKLTLGTVLDGQQINLTSDLVRENGLISLPSISADIGQNQITGSLELGADFLPTGKINADLADLSTLAKLAGQQVEGDLKLTVDLSARNGALAATINGTGSRIATPDVVMSEPIINIESADLLAQRIGGAIKSREIAAGANRLEALEATFDHQANSTTFDLKSRFDGAPLTARGLVDQQPDGIQLSLNAFSASPRKIPLSLAMPAKVTISGGTTTIEPVMISAGSGTVTIEGTAADTLSLNIDATALPASLINGLAPDLDVSGTVSAKASISGNATSPVVNFEMSATSISAKPLKDAGRPPLRITSKGTFANALLSAQTTIGGIAELGDLRTDAGIRLGEDIRIEKFIFNSDALNGSVMGTFSPATQAIATTFDINVTGQNLIPASIAAKLDGPLRVTGKLDGTPDDLAFNGIKLVSNIVSADASGTMKSGVLQANVTGALPDLSAFQPDITGTAQFSAEASGPTSALAIKAQLTSAQAVLAGRPLKDLAVNVDSVIDPASPSAKLTATGTLDGQAINVAGDLVTSEGLISIPSLKADIGRNTLSAGLAFDRAFRPTGNVTFDLPDLGLLAALAGQQATGDLKGQADLTTTDGKMSARIKASGAGITAQGLTIRNPAVDLDIPDLLTGQISGTVKAAELAAGANRLANLDADFALAGARTDFTVNGTLDEQPLIAKGAITRQPEGMDITLAEFSASPRKLPIKLASPATVKIAGGVTDLGDLQFSIGSGTMKLSGTASDTLNISAKAADLPAALANTFAADLGADGTISANATVTGTATAPSITFDVTGRGLIVRQIRDAGLAPLDVTSKGTFTNNLLSAETVIDGIEKLGQTRVTSNVALAADRISVQKLDVASEKLNGNATADYTLATKQLNAAFDLSAIADGLLPPQIAAKVKGPAALSGKIAGAVPGDITISDLNLTSNVLTADGTATLKGNDLQAKLSGDILDIAAFHPDASGKAQFTADASGPLAALKVKAALTATEAILAGRPLKNLDLKIDGVADRAKPSGKVTASGTLDNQKIDVSADLVTDQGRISVPALKANIGRNSLTGAIQLAENFLPSGNLKFDFPDIGLLAALGGQKASGDISGQIDLANADGKIAAKLKAKGTGIIAQGVTIKNPAIDLDIPDLLSGQISGTAKAGELASGLNRLANLDASFALSGAKTDFDIRGNFDGAPLVAKGAVENGPDGLSLTLANFVASPKKIPVKLSSPVTIRMVDGAADIANLTIATGRGTITVNGTAGNNLDLKIKVTALPASLANTFASGLDAGGTISANATVSGTPASPMVNFDVNWQSAMTSQIRAAGIPALVVTAKGKLENKVLSINTNVRGGGGLTLSANGTVGTTGSQSLNLSVKGQLPFSAIAAQLAAQGLALKGNANFDLKIGGNASNPQITGRITTAGSQFIAIRQNLIVNRLGATVTLSGQTATISNLSGRLEGGGTVSASGTIGIRPGSNFPADLKIKLDDTVYADGRVVVAKMNGDLNVKGPLLGSATLGGSIRLRRADITVPERLPASLANANVKHKNAPREVVKQSRELRADTTSTADKNKAGGMRLSLKIVAPRQIFVRGRGLDAELGGEVLISGSASAPSVSGGFKMRRGRLAIIGKRLDFTTGQITFGGGLVPALNMVASTVVNATTLNVNVNGPANDPSFSFTSSPALPQDEVLAQLIFGRDSASLSPFQIAQLADAVATLSGGQRTSLFNKLRQGLGVDDLNVGTDENGGAQVTAGKYINRRTYLELKQGEDATKSGVAINLDIGKGVKLRGEATADGNTSTGIFYEKEY